MKWKPRAFQQAFAPVFIETFIPKPSIEGVDVGVLIGLVWLDQKRHDASRSWSQLSIASSQSSLPLSVLDGLGQASGLGQLIQNSHRMLFSPRLAQARRAT